MDNPSTLLTAIMFVTVLSMGIGNLLMACAEIAGGQRQPPPERLHLSWIILLLLVMLNLFWETTAILDVEDWAFLNFLYMIAGPMVLLFASGLIIAPVVESDTPHGHYFSLSGRFFLMLAIHGAWLLGLDVQFDALTPASALDGALLALFAVLAFSKSYQLHLAGNGLTWVGFMASLMLSL